MPDSPTSWLVVAAIVALFHTGPFFLGLGGQHVGRDRRPLDFRCAVIGYAVAIASALYLRTDLMLLQYISLTSVAVGLVTGVVARRTALARHSGIDSRFQ